MQINGHTCIGDDGGTPNRHCAACEEEKKESRKNAEDGAVISYLSAIYELAYVGHSDGRAIRLEMIARYAHEALTRLGVKPIPRDSADPNGTYDRLNQQFKELHRSRRNG